METVYDRGPRDLGELLPRGVPFEAVNLVMTKRRSRSSLILLRKAGHRETVMMLDRIKDLGYFYATRAGISISIDDMPHPDKKASSSKKRSTKSRKSSGSTPTA